MAGVAMAAYFRPSE